MLKIAIITAYYGKFPGYYRAWLRSAQCNPDIDFYIVTDLRVDRLPENVKTIPLALDEFRILIENKLGRKVRLQRSYKICDYRPMYGVIFEDLLKSYDWWAYADMDVVFGNIRKFLNLYNIEEYERFMHLGHLSFYKNTPESNHYFMLDGSPRYNWKEVVSTNKNCLFDEWNGIYGIYKTNNIPMFDKFIFADISENYKRFRLSRVLENYDNQVFYWQNGGVFRTYIENGQLKEEEFIYIHFKKRHFSREAFDVFSADGFFICPDGIVKKENSSTTMADIEKYNPYPGKIYEMWETVVHEVKYFFFRLRRKTKNILETLFNKEEK